MKLSKWIWKCPHKDCESKGLGPLPFYKAARSGRGHLRNKHKEYNREPTMIKAEEV